MQLAEQAYKSSRRQCCFQFVHSNIPNSVTIEDVYLVDICFVLYFLLIYEVLVPVFEGLIPKDNSI
jgi:hypothetical protein